MYKLMCAFKVAGGALLIVLKVIAAVYIWHVHMYQGYIIEFVLVTVYHIPLIIGPP